MAHFCTSSARFAPSSVRHPNGPKCTQIVRNALNISLGSNGVDRVGSLRKILTRLRGTNFCTSSARFVPSFVRQPNGPECTQKERNTHQNVCLGSNGVYRVRSLRKIPTRLHGTNYCTSLARSAPSFVRQPNSTKRTKTSVYGAMGWIRCVRCEKFRHDFVAQTFALHRPILHRVS